MANTQHSLLGMKPFARPGTRINIGYYTANTGADLFLYQPVAMNNSGQVQVATAADLSGILGVIVGFVDSNQASLPSDMTDLNQASYLQNGNNALVAVAHDPNQLFTLEEDTGGTILGSANSAGWTGLWTYDQTTGSTVTGISRTVLDRSTFGADTGGCLTLVAPYREFVNRDGTINDVTTNFAKWIVKINNHQLGLANLYNPGVRPS